MTDSKFWDLAKYSLTAFALKLFSVSPRLYRQLGNTFGAKRRVRTAFPPHYASRIKRFSSLCERHRTVKDGDRVLEIGTGWMHFESIVLRLLYDVEATLFDVWDNRQLDALQACFAGLERQLFASTLIDEAQRSRLERLLGVISDAESFTDLYQGLGFRYIVDKTGTLESLFGETFDFIYSHNVLEHVNRGIVSRVVQDFHRVLQPGASSIHTIDLSDHLVSFSRARGLSKKHYLRYSDTTWKRFGENRVQYINRIQRPEWIGLFDGAGFEMLEEQVDTCDIDTGTVARDFEHLDIRSLMCNRLVVVHRKPSLER